MLAPLIATRILAPMAPRSLSRDGFTLVELLVVVAILAVLLAMLTPAMGLVRNSARQSQCLSDLRQIQLANAAYASDNNGFYVQLNSSGASAAWYTNLAFLDLLDQKASTWPRQLLCPESYTVTSGGFKVSSSYGANVGGVSLSPTIPVIAFAVARIPRPADKMAWTDSWDWWIDDWNSSKFDYERKPNNVAPTWTDSMATAYRHQGKCGIAFYDGHVEMRARSQVDTGMSSGAAKTALQQSLWFVTTP